MPTVTLSSRIYSDAQLRIVENQLRSLFRNLRIEISRVEKTEDSRVKIEFLGEDEKIVLNYLERKIGLCPSTLENLSKFSTVKGYIVNLEKSVDELLVDMGIENPQPLFAHVPLQTLQAQLADGRKIALSKIAELYGLCENMPITIKITAISENNVEAILAEAQLRRYREWIKSLLDRLLIIGAAKAEVERALKRTRCWNDVIEIEPLGLFENSVICRLGTDAAGLVPKVGKHIPDAAISIFNPKKIIKFLGEFIYKTKSLRESFRL